jgi:hypothetical protein
MDSGASIHRTRGMNARQPRSRLESEHPEVRRQTVALLDSLRVGR